MEDLPSTQLQAYGLLLEYRALRANGPRCVFVLPSPHSLFEWHGVVFVRQGNYRGGVFRFVLDIPENYPHEAPSVKFTTPLFHPNVSPDDGKLDLTPQFPEWRARKDYIMHSLNQEAKELLSSSPAEYNARCKACAADSARAARTNPSGFAIRFSEPKEEHDHVMDLLRTDYNPDKVNYPFHEWFSESESCAKPSDNP